MAYDSAFVEELVADVEAYLQRCNVLTDFAESQVEERVRLARLLNEVAADRDGFRSTIDGLRQQVESLDARLRAVDQSIAVRLTRMPGRVLRKARRRKVT
ncbi:MAG: hypothetical protein ABI949_01845 [Ilumatobacteraceae bacterium]